MMHDPIHIKLASSSYDNILFDFIGQLEYDVLWREHSPYEGPRGERITQTLSFYIAEVF